jgi:hypothetical protein
LILIYKKRGGGEKKGRGKSLRREKERDPSGEGGSKGWV